MIENGPTQHVWEKNIQRNSRGLKLAGQSERIRSPRRNENFESFLVRQIAQNGRVMRIVLNDQQDGVARLEAFAIIANLRHETLRYCASHLSRQVRRRGSFAVHRNDASGWPHINLRQVERKRAAPPRRTLQLYLAAQQACELAADCESQTRAAVFATGSCVGLLEGFENNPLLFGGNPNTGIGNLKCNYRWRCRQNRMVLAPTACDRRHRQAYAPLLGELERV